MSVIVIIALIRYGFTGPYKNYSIYAICVAGITVFLIGLVVCVERDGEKKFPLKFPIFVLFALLWIVLAALVTFKGPFLITGNGYFGSWAGAIFGVMTALTARKSGQSLDGE